jgi:ATP-dependent DNA helicase RecG
MELIEYLKEQEGKTLEFKENCSPLPKIVQTAVAFANTAGGTLIIGVRDKTKEIVELPDPLKEEERLSNAFADGIHPLMIPEIRIISFRDRNLITVSVPHAIGPYYVRSEGPEKGVYVRLGSTNRRAGPEMIEALRRLARNISFDEQPCTEINSEDIDFRAASEFFETVSRKLTPSIRKTLGLVVSQGGKDTPTLGAALLFGKSRHRLFPDAVIRCARFQGVNTNRFLDQMEIDEHLPKAVETTIAFIERHTLQAVEIGRVRRREIPEYPVQAIREAVINAIVHTDYAISGMNIKVAIFDNRIEITNPGSLPFGLTLEAALSGVSKLRNRVIGRVFRDLKLIEQWGTGINRMISACKAHGQQPPHFEEVGSAFRVTLFSQPVADRKFPDWHASLIAYFSENKEITTKEAAQIWNTSDRTARTRLRNLLEQGYLIEIGTGPNDPKKVYVLKRK